MILSPTINLEIRNRMSSNQIPAPLANFSFPPETSEQLQFNYIDSFVTTWVTPEGSHEPCFLSLYYWNSSDPKAPWKSRMLDAFSSVFVDFSRTLKRDD